MDYVQLGNTGLQVSKLCLGTMSFGTEAEERPWVIGLDEARPIFRQAWEAGINFVDTANVYADGTSEELTGRLIKEFGPREDVVLATKVRFNRLRPGPNGSGLSRKIIFYEIDQSLKRLGTDYVDLYQIHRYDPNTPYEETMEALHDVVKAGKARYIGASSMFAWQFAKYQHAAEANGWTRFVSMQNQVSLIYREEEREMLPLCREDGIGVIPWSPLGFGLLARPWGTPTNRSTTDKQYDDPDDANRQIVAAVERVAKARGVSMAEVALAWVLAQDGITAPIVGATKASHVDGAVKALELTLTPDELAELEEPYRPRDVPGF